MLASIAQDDVERTIRYYNLDGGVIRFPGYAAMKRSKPGIFSKRKGGISAAHTATAYSEEARSAIDSLIKFVISVVFSCLSVIVYVKVYMNSGKIALLA